MSDELKPCAHCGSTPCVKSEPSHIGDLYIHVILCACGIRTKEYFEAAEAFDAWNRRATPSPTHVLVERSLLEVVAFYLNEAADFAVGHYAEDSQWKPYIELRDKLREAAGKGG